MSPSVVLVMSLFTVMSGKKKTAQKTHTSFTTLFVEVREFPSQQISLPSLHSTVIYDP